MLGKRLNSVRHMRGYTAKQMAAWLNIETRSYRSYESGDRQPSLDTIVRIADILDVSLDYLLGRDEFIARHAEEKV